MAQSEVTTRNAPALDNPFKSPVKTAEGTGVAIEAHKAQIEMMMQFRVAKEFPRDMKMVGDKAIAEAQRPALAELAEYSYSRGGTEISGASIRLLESLARCMGNIRSGWEVLEANAEKSSIRAYAVDMENNTVAEVKFSVKHWRALRNNKGYALTDERDIYELCANQAQRRVRACLEKLMPRELIDVALAQCDKTAEASVDTTPEGLQKLLAAFNRIGVNKAMIEAKFQGRKLEGLKPRQLLALRKNWTAINDGMAKIGDFFDTKLATNKDDDYATPQQEQSGQPDLKEDIASKDAEKAAPTPEGEQTSGEKQEKQVETPPEKPDVLQMERDIRAAIGKASNASELDSISVDFEEQFQAIRDNAPAAYKTLMDFYNNSVSKFGG